MSSLAKKRQKLWKKLILIRKKDGFYYPNEKKTSKVIIAMLGDSSDDRLAVSDGFCYGGFLYAYRHPEYWQKIKEESQMGGDMIASRKMFDESERLHPVQESEKIKVENIKGKIVFVGADDDALWDN